MYYFRITGKPAVGIGAFVTSDLPTTQTEPWRLRYRGKRPDATHCFASTFGEVRFVLDVEQFLGVTVGNFQAVRFADRSLVEPSGDCSGGLCRYARNENLP